MSGWKWMAEKNLMKIPTGLGKKIDEKRAYGFRMLFLIVCFSNKKPPAMLGEKKALASRKKPPVI